MERRHISGVKLPFVAELSPLLNRMASCSISLTNPKKRMMGERKRSSQASKYIVYSFLGIGKKNSKGHAPLKATAEVHLVNKIGGGVISVSMKSRRLGGVSSVS